MVCLKDVVICSGTPYEQIRSATLYGVEFRFSHWERAAVFIGPSHNILDIGVREDDSRLTRQRCVPREITGFNVFQRRFRPCVDEAYKYFDLDARGWSFSSVNEPDRKGERLPDCKLRSDLLPCIFYLLEFYPCTLVSPHYVELGPHDYHLVNTGYNECQRKYGEQPIRDPISFDSFAKMHKILLFVLSHGVGCLLGCLLIGAYQFVFAKPSLWRFLPCALLCVLSLVLVFTFAHASHG